MGIGVISFYSSDHGCSRCMSTRREISALSTGVKLYALDNHKLLNSTKDLSLLVPKYMDSIPKDAWGRDLNYSKLNSDGKDCFVIWSFGSDNKSSGGKDHEMDIFMGQYLTR